MWDKVTGKFALHDKEFLTYTAYTGSARVVNLKGLRCDGHIAKRR